MRQAFYTSLSQSDSRAVDIGIKTQKTGHRDRGKLWNDREFRGVFYYFNFSLSLLIQERKRE